MPASWYLLTAHSSCIKQPIKHHAPRSLGLQRCSQYPACPHSQPRSSVPSLLQPASSPASSRGSRWSGALRPAGSTLTFRFNFGCSLSRCRSSSRCWRSSRCWSSSCSLRRAYVYVYIYSRCYQQKHRCEFSTALLHLLLPRT